MKAHAALTNMGGGKAGQQDRLGGKAGHAKFQVRSMHATQHGRSAHTEHLPMACGSVHVRT